MCRPLFGLLKWWSLLSSSTFLLVEAQSFPWRSFLLSLTPWCHTTSESWKIFQTWMIFILKTPLWQFLMSWCRVVLHNLCLEKYLETILLLTLMVVIIFTMGRSLNPITFYQFLNAKATSSSNISKVSKSWDILPLFRLRAPVNDCSSVANIGIENVWCYSSSTQELLYRLWKSLCVLLECLNSAQWCLLFL